MVIIVVKRLSINKVGLLRFITVALDAMGGDFGPCVTVPAAVQALSLFPELKVILVGDQTSITTQLSQTNTPAFIHRYLQQNDPSDSRLTILHSDFVVANNDKPSFVLRHNVDSSMRMAIDLVEKEQADACVSGGNTGALMALSCFRLKLLTGIDRPALISSLPTRSGNKVWMLDLGANVHCDTENLFQFALMGSSLAEQHLNRKARVALLNIGEEANKGNDQIKRCADLLAQTKTIDFIGYIEGDQLLNDSADVIVCDGFAGNICLKTCEGTARFFLKKLKHYMMASSIKAWIARKLFADLFIEMKTLNPDQYNGASLLGLRGIVIKSHGHADISAVTSAIGEAVHEAKRQIPSRINERLEAVQHESCHYSS